MRQSGDAFEYRAMVVGDLGWIAFYNGGRTDIDSICATLGISRATLYGYLNLEHTMEEGVWPRRRH